MCHRNMMVVVFSTDRVEKSEAVIPSFAKIRSWKRRVVFRTKRAASQNVAHPDESTNSSHSNIAEKLKKSEKTGKLTQNLFKKSRKSRPTKFHRINKGDTIIVPWSMGEALNEWNEKRTLARTTATDKECTGSAIDGRHAEVRGPEALPQAPL